MTTRADKHSGNGCDRPTINRVMASPGFVIALALLLLNDHLLKWLFPGLLSGKLSDFAGLFMVGLLVVSLRRVPALFAMVAVAVLFVWWKSPFSGAAIEAWNGLGLWSITRVVDYSDLLALLSLPAAYRYSRVCRSLLLAQLLRIPLVTVTAFAIGATSMVPYSSRLSVPDLHPAGTVGNSDTNPFCDEALLVELEAIIRDSGYHALEQNGDCSKPASDSYYRLYDRRDGAFSVALSFDPGLRVATLELTGYGGFRDKAERLRRQLRDTLLARGYPLLVGGEVVSRQGAVARARVVITPAEQYDPLYPSHAYDLRRLPLKLDRTLAEMGFLSAGSQACGNDAFYGADRVCAEYVAAGGAEEKPDGALTTVTLTAYLVEGQPPMEAYIVQYGEGGRFAAEQVARDLQEALQADYPALSVAVELISR